MVEWRLDTCECVIEITPNDSGVWEPVSILNQCNYHSSITTAGELFTALMDENPRKNYSRQEVLENVPSSWTELDENGNLRLKNGITFTTSWDGLYPNRLLIIEIYGATLTTKEINRIQNILKNRFGDNKVLVRNGQA